MFKIDIQRAGIYYDDLKLQQKKLYEIMDSLLRLSNRLEHQESKEMDGIRGYLYEIKKKMEEEIFLLGQIIAALDRGIQIFAETEQRIIQNLDSAEISGTFHHAGVVDLSFITPLLREIEIK